MSKITSFNPTVCRLIQKDLEAALKTVADKHGLTVSRAGGGKYDTLSYSPKVEFKVTETADGTSAAQAEFERFAPMLGIPADWYGKTFQSNFRQHKIESIRPAAWKAPIITVSGGKRYKFSIELVRMYLGQNKNQETTVVA